jgi:hypothetical protein
VIFSVSCVAVVDLWAVILAIYLEKLRLILDLICYCLSEREYGNYGGNLKGI